MIANARTDFLYFDLGNVLLNFDHRRAARQIAAVAGVSPEIVWTEVFESQLQWRYERGEVSSLEFCQAFMEATQTRSDWEQLLIAASDIFELNLGVLPIVVQLRRAGHRLGVLSNTNEAHWKFVASGRYTFLPRYFDECVLSYEVKAMKPEPEIYATAIERARLAPNQIFFVDDRPENVAAAQRAGIDAVQYTTPRQLAADLHSRNVAFNY